MTASNFKANSRGLSTLDAAALGLAPSAVLLKRTSLTVHGTATQEDLTKIEAVLDELGGSVMWWHGDYLLHLIETQGEQTAKEKAGTSYAPQSLFNAIYVCRYVDVSRRRQTLSFSHHQEVAAMSPTDQEVWLAKAETDELTVKELRTAIRQSKQTITCEKDQAPVDPRASAATRAFHEWASWYQGQEAKMPAAQREAWRDTLKPVITDYLAHLDEEDLAALLEARARALGKG